MCVCVRARAFVCARELELQRGERQTDRQTETETETDRDRDRDRDRQTDRQTDRQRVCTTRPGMCIAWSVRRTPLQHIDACISHSFR